MRRRTVLAPMLLLVGAIAVSVWTATVPRRYGGIVTYRRVSVIGSSPYWSLGTSTVIQEWSDRQHRRDRLQLDGLAHPIVRITREGRTYDSNAFTHAFFAGPAGMAMIQWFFAQGCGTGTSGRPSAAGAAMQLDAGSGYVATVRCVPERRIASGTLAADFFDPPRRSMVDQLLGWLRDHAGGKI